MLKMVNEVPKSDFNKEKSSVSHKKKEVFSRLIKERALEFSDIKK